MQKEYYLMLEDTPVLYMHFDDMEVKLFDKNLLPLSIRNKILEPNSDNIKEYYKQNSKNLELIKDFAASRVLSLSRENAKKICTALSLSQDNSTQNRAEICFSCKGVSLTDSYWFKEPDSNEKWADVDLRHKHLAEIIDVALAGEQPTVTANPDCPELTTKGLFQKCWIRENDDVYLLKSDRTKNFINTKAEILASDILDCTNIPHVKYEETRYKDLTVCKCKNFVPEHISFVEAHDVMECCKNNHVDYASVMIKTFGKDFANIAVIDYILQNTDRHDQNYGFFMDNKSGKLICVAPLFDHNLALIADFQEKDVSDTLSQMLGSKTTIKECYDKFAPYAKIEFNSKKWLEIEQKYPEYKNILKRVGERIAETRCIQKIMIPDQSLDFDKMLENLENQRDVCSSHTLENSEPNIER